MTEGDAEQKLPPIILDDLNKELDSINLMRETDLAGYRKNEAVQARERTLLAEREKLETAAERKAELQAVAKVFAENEKQDSITANLLELKGWEAGLLVSEMGKPRPSVTAASPDDVKEFAARGKVYKAMIEEWGSDAPRYLAVLKARLDRMMSINPDGIQALLATASDDEIKSIFRRLSQ